MTSALWWQFLITFWGDWKDDQIITNDWNLCITLSITQTLSVPRTLIQRIVTNMFFCNDLSKKSQITIQWSWHYEVKNCKIRNCKLEITYISPFAVLFFRSVLIASTDYSKLFCFSLPLKHIWCLLYVNMFFYILFSLYRLVKVLFFLKFVSFLYFVYCSTIEAFWRCSQRYHKIIEKIFVLEPFLDEIDQTKDIFEKIFRNSGNSSYVKHL